jgi:DNA modification methylase
MEQLKYEEFLSQKVILEAPSGFEPIDDDLPDNLFSFQKAIVKWAIKKGRAAIFADTGLGKTMMQVAWADYISKKTKKQVLIVAPLCVAQQTITEAKKLDIDVFFSREYEDSHSILITNYEMVEAFSSHVNAFSAIVLDESSIIKNEDSKTKQKLISISQSIQYRLSCTATPSPNDYMELGTQAEFLGIMDSKEMLALFFTHDSSETQKWRLKGHGEERFWEWLSTWAVYIKTPSDIGFSDDGYVLPPLNIEQIRIGGFFNSDIGGIEARQRVKKETVEERVKEAIKIANSKNEPFIIWCFRNDESTLLKKLMPNAVEVSGADELEDKKDKIMAFTNQKERILISKPKICGFGMNWQFCNNIIFVGLTDSYEQIYQSIRRCWRFGQKNTVNAYFIVHSKEGKILSNIERKQTQLEDMSKKLASHMQELTKKEITQIKKERMEYIEDIAEGIDWKLYLGDSIELTKKIKTDSIGYSIFSPPFASLYTYSNSDRDMGNNKTYEEFWQHFDFLIPELHRIMMPGRCVSVHCMNLPTSKTRDGYIGIRDFRGDIIRAFQKAGFIYQSEAVIWKDPVVAMQRTKALGLLWKQIQKDSTMCRQGIPDYLITFRKAGENPNPVNHTKEEFPVNKWQHYASPCWMDINQSNTLNGKLARENEDERHIAPLQLDVIYRGVDLWSKEGDTVFSPFAGIGSEGFVAIQNKRKFIGIELKESYWRIAADNLRMANDIKTDYSSNQVLKKKIKSANYNNSRLTSFLEASTE